MFSLDVVRWRKSRSEQEAARLKHAEKNAASPSRAVQERQTKHLYGKSMKEMHNTYLDRVGDWVREAPTQEWGKDYAKEDYSKAYLVFTSRYLQRGGKYVRRAESSHDEVEMPREKYAERIVNFEKTREKHKEIHPPMAFLKNKPLSCAKYFVEDIMCADNNAQSEHESNDVMLLKVRKEEPLVPQTVRRRLRESIKPRKRTAVRMKTAQHEEDGKVPCMIVSTGTYMVQEQPCSVAQRRRSLQRQPSTWLFRNGVNTVLKNGSVVDHSPAPSCQVTHTPRLAPVSRERDPFAPAGITSSPTTPEVRASVRPLPARINLPRYAVLLRNSPLAVFYLLRRSILVASKWQRKPPSSPSNGQTKNIQLHVDGSTEGRTHVFFDATADTSSDARRSTAESPFQASSLPSPTRKTNVGRELFQQIRLQHQQPPSVSKKQLKSN
ncbi:hypothetical protein GQ600_3143 [Phytophthora cactorum]|nr:hypothetical protein GQ600_3143 [Phytophthora cactorum]